MDKTINKKKTNVFKLVPGGGWISGFLGFFFCWGFYQLAFLVSSNCIAGKFCTKIILIDDAIPFVPYFFAEIYVLSYLFGIITPIAISTSKRENFFDFIFSYGTLLIVASLICALCPTYMNRLEENLFNLSEGSGLSKGIIRTVYKFDGGNVAYNLCPSSHCFLSMLCGLGVLRKKDMHIGYRIFAPIMAGLIILSTVFVKQHYFLDTICGVSIAIIVYEIFYLTKVGQKFNQYIISKQKKKER